jgi:hypothetical protein
MRRVGIIGVLAVICFWFPRAAQAQKSEVGFGLGTFTYTGDLARSYSFRNSKFAATLLYRSNLSKVVSFRVAATAGSIGATDKHPADAFAQQRNASFNLFLFEGSTVMEYHFLNWRDDKRILRFTPYLFGGLGLFGFSGNAEKKAEYSNVQGMIPFGAGVKYILNPLWYVSLEFGMRKTFFDYLDNVSAGGDTKNYQYGFTYDNDRYYFLGVTLTRTFYEIPCPKNPYK